MVNAAGTDKLSGKKKAAIIMVAIGEDHAAKIYKNLKEEEIEVLTLEVATLQKLEPDKMAEVLNEFYEMCLAQKFVMEGGVDYAKGILQKAFGVQNAQEVIDKVIISIGNKSFDFMKKADPKQLFNFIQNEHPQTIALILSYATKSQASALLGMFPKEKQLSIIERIALMDRTSPDVIKDVETMLQKKLSTIGAAEITDIGGIKFTAELMNSVDRSTEKYIFDELAKKDDNLANEIRKLMFVFEDVVTLDDFAMSMLVKEIDGKDLRVALKNANEEVRGVFFRNISKRNVEQILDDMEYLKNIRHRDIEAAQQRIVSKIRELEEAGRIVVSHGRDDVVV